MRPQSIGFLLVVIVSMLLTGAPAQGAVLVLGATGISPDAGSLPCLADLSQSRTFDTGGAQGVSLMQVCSLSGAVVLSSQIRVDVDSTVGVVLAAFTGFGLYDLDVRYDPLGPGNFVAGDILFELERSLDGNIVWVTFGSVLAPGQDGMVLYFLTNAPSYTINTGTGTVWDEQRGFDPFTTISLSGTPIESRVPEPRITPFFLAGVVFFFTRRLRRKLA